MRALILSFVACLGLTASTQAAPLAPQPAEIALGTTPPVELVDHACGWGLHRIHWQTTWLLALALRCGSTRSPRPRHEARTALLTLARSHRGVW